MRWARRWAQLGRRFLEYVRRRMGRYQECAPLLFAVARALADLERAISQFSDAARRRPLPPFHVFQELEARIRRAAGELARAIRTFRQQCPGAFPIPPR
jgi:hypothetical protein